MADAPFPFPSSHAGFRRRTPLLLLLVSHHEFQTGQPPRRYRRGRGGGGNESCALRWMGGSLSGIWGLDRSVASRPDPSRASLPSGGFPSLACATGAVGGGVPLLRRRRQSNTMLLQRNVSSSKIATFSSIFSISMLSHDLSDSITFSLSK